MQPSIWQLLIVAALVLILFGRGRISEMMGDVGKGIRSFKRGITDDDEPAATPKEEDKPMARLEGPGESVSHGERNSTTERS